MSQWFQIVQPGTASYAAGGFTIAAPEFEAIESATVFMTPETLLTGSSRVVTCELSYTGNVATVKVFQRSGTALWTELTNENLGGANFILTGKGY